jgi:hypothetical protein
MHRYFDSLGVINYDTLIYICICIHYLEYFHKEKKFLKVQIEAGDKAQWQCPYLACIEINLEHV